MSQTTPETRIAAVSVALLVVASVMVSGIGVISGAAAGADSDTVHANITEFGPDASAVAPLEEETDTGSGGGTKTIRSCTNITAPGKYVLTQNITQNGRYYCIHIKSSNVVIDGAGHNITGKYDTYAVMAGGKRSLTNVTVKNLNISDDNHGVYYNNVSGGYISKNNINVIGESTGIYVYNGSKEIDVVNNTVDAGFFAITLRGVGSDRVENNKLSGSEKGYSAVEIYSNNNSIISNYVSSDNDANGIMIASAENTVIKNNVVVGDGGIYANNLNSHNHQGTPNNIIYNNILNTTHNVMFFGENTNTRWNISQINTKNIIGGSISGGNFYATPTGTGFSQICDDANGDGICDNPNNFSENNNNTDFLPLTNASQSSNTPPSASFAAPSSATVGDQVRFDASVSSDPDGSIANYEWDFGDGASASGETTSHTYTSNGTYTVTLTVTDDDGTSDTATQTITVSKPTPTNDDPSASFTYTPHLPETSQQVNFDASGSDDSDGSIQSYDWTFDDSISASGKQVNHTYDSTGNYTVTLTVEDDDGATDMATRTITVTPTEERILGHTLTIRGTGPAAQYAFSVTGGLAKSTANGANRNANDEIHRGYAAQGEVGTSADSYTFNGSLETIHITGDAEVFVDGERLSEAAVANKPDTMIEVRGTGPAAQYAFSVTGDLAKSAANGANRNVNDEIRRRYVGDGEVGIAADSYTFDGTLETIDVNGDAEVYLNGKRLTGDDIEDMPDNAIEVEGTGSAAQYAFAATGSESLQKITANNANLNVNDKTWRTTANGEVGAARDAYGFNGIIDSLAIAGDANVYVNGRPKDPASNHAHVITIVGTGEAAQYDFKVESALAKTTANDANFNRNDRVAGNTASGEVGIAADSFVYNGDISEFTTDGDVTVYIDGEQQDQGNVGS